MIEEQIKLKEEINGKREKLNHIILYESDKAEILKLSQDLDILISQYIKYLNSDIKSSG